MFQDVDVPKFVQGMTEALEKTGFTQITLTKIDQIPEHIKKWVSQDLDAGDDVEEFSEVLTYIKVETGEGTFGLVLSLYPILDLEGSGVSLKEFDPEQAASNERDLADSDFYFPAIIGITEDEQLHRLLSLFKEKKSTETA